MDDARRLRAALTEAGYTAEGVHAALGPTAAAALARGEREPGLRATAGGGRLADLIRLFLLGADLDPAAAEAAVGGVRRVLRRRGDRVRAAVEVRPYGEDWYVVSDRPPLRRPEAVAGVGAASLTLVRATPTDPVATALDIGTGCGVQALHLSRFAGAVTGTDVNPRALRLARFGAQLSGVDVELQAGDGLAPVAGRRFDLVVANPPFVIGPGLTLHYRDSGLRGDEMSRRLVAGLPGVLTDGGTAVLLASWLHRRGEDWRDRVGGWLAGTGLDGWAVQREVLDPAAHTDLWLRDAGLGPADRAYHENYARWLDELAGLDADGIGFGLVALRRAGAAEPAVRVEDVHDPDAELTGDVVADFFAGQEGLRRAPLPATVLAPAPGLQLEATSAAGPAGWEPAGQALVQPAGLRRTAQVDEVGAALIAGCDGRRPVSAVLAVAEVTWGLDPQAALPVLRRLVDDGFLRPVLA